MLAIIVVLPAITLTGCLKRQTWSRPLLAGCLNPTSELIKFEVSKQGDVVIMTIRTEHYEFSISNADCTKLLHYYAAVGGKSHELLLELYKATGLGMDESDKYLSRAEVIFGLEKIISVIEKRKTHEYRIYKLRRFLELAVYPGAEDEMFFLHIQIGQTWNE